MLYYIVTENGDTGTFNLDHTMDLLSQLARADIDYTVEPVGKGVRKGEKDV